MNEFDIINNFFTQKKSVHQKDVVLGMGDDCALVKTPPDQLLAITTDTLIEDVHFLKNTNPADIGYKSLAVNLSDLAAMGATPAWFTLALSLPSNDTQWLQTFTQGLFAIARDFQVELIGGDLTKAPQLTITIAAYGFVEKNKALTRSGARPGDAICVTHTLGDALVGLNILKNLLTVPTQYSDFFIQKLQRPEPRIDIGKRLKGNAHAAIDISDGLLGDLSHILEASSVGALIDIDTIPLSDAMKASFSHNKAIEYALTGGDDYELCFIIPEKETSSLPPFCKKIGDIIEEKGLILLKNNKPFEKIFSSYQHFR